MIDKPMSKYSFKIMKLVLGIRDLFTSPHKILSDIDMIRPGTHVLDYGCGPGNYTIAAAEMVGPSGKVYAADIHPLAIREVRKKADMKGISNIDTILTDSKIGLPNGSVDVVLLFYVLHDFRNPDLIIKEIDRVLKPTGILAVVDHKFDNDKVVAVIDPSLRNLKLRKIREDRNKKTMLIFFKEQVT